MATGIVGGGLDSGGFVLIVEDGMSWARSDFPVELLEPAEMAEADRLTARTVPGSVLMARAGTAVAEVVVRRLGTAPRRRVLILCGPGNNGGDGYVAARVLADAGCDVTIATLGVRADLRGDAAAAASQWSGGTIPLGDAVFAEADLVVDALFGAGLSRPIEGPARTAIAALNAWADAARGPVVAVDMPSGIDGAGGQVRGIAVAATETVTFFRLKPGHVLLPGRVHCGAITLADIGIDAGVFDAIGPKTRLNTPRLWAARYPWPRLDGHKYSRGHALVVSGPLAQTGAARLCARGALRAGAGLVTVATPAEALPVHAMALSAIMTRICDNADDLTAILEDGRKNVVAMGPGLGVGAATRALVLAVLAAPPASNPPRRVVLDADALTSFVDQPDVLFAAVATSGHSVAMTPHDGEFARLFGKRLDLSEAKPRRALAAARLSGAIIVLKGPDTVVAHPDGRAAIAASEAPWLATAGSGDVLAGMIAGLLAQPMPPFEAACAAVWLHAEAARLFGPGLISEDIPEMLPKALGTLAKRGSRPDLIDET